MLLLAQPRIGLCFELGLHSAPDKLCSPPLEPPGQKTHERQAILDAEPLDSALGTRGHRGGEERGISIRAKGLPERWSMPHREGKLHTPVQYPEEPCALDGAGAHHGAPSCPHGGQQDGLQLEQTMGCHAPWYCRRVGAAQVALAAITARHRRRIARKPVKIDDGTTGPTAVQQASVVGWADRHKREAPPPPKVGVGIGVQTLGTILHPGPVTRERVPVHTQEPWRSCADQQCLLGIAPIAARRGRYDTVAWGRRLGGHLPQERVIGPGIKVITPYRTVRPDLGPKTGRLGTIRAAQAHEPGREHLVVIRSPADGPPPTRQPRLTQGVQPGGAAPRAVPSQWPPGPYR